MRLLTLLEYLALASSELLLFCYYGEVIERHSVRVGDALMRSPWSLCGSSFRKGILIMMSNSIKAVRFTGGKFYSLNLEKCIQVYRTAFSYYTLLQNIK